MATIFTLSTPAFAQKVLVQSGKNPTAIPAQKIINLVGTYEVTGNTPGQQGEYKGTLKITKTDNTYQVTWTLGQETNFGTGLLQGDSFAVAYTNSNGSFFGLVLYKIIDGGKKLDGIWTMAGANQYGHEIIVKQSALVGD